MESADGRQKYHTPQSLEGATIARMIVAPFELMPTIGGALGQLIDENNWYEAGVSVGEVLEEMFKMIDIFYEPQWVGAVMAFVKDEAPPGWLILDGSIVTDADEKFPELWAVAPTNWKSGTNFILPDMVFRSLVGSEQISTGRFDRGQTGGLEQVALTVSEMPSHSHTYVPPTVNLDVEGPGVPDIGATVIGSPTSTGSAGGDEAHENMPPYMTVVWAVFAGREP